MPALPLIATALLEVKPDFWELQEGREGCSFFLNLRILPCFGWEDLGQWARLCLLLVPVCKCYCPINLRNWPIQQPHPIRTLEKSNIHSFFPSSILNCCRPKDAAMSDFPEIKSTHSLVAKHVTPELWAKVKR